MCFLTNFLSACPTKIMLVLLLTLGFTATMYGSNSMDNPDSNICETAKGFSGNFDDYTVLQDELFIFVSLDCADYAAGFADGYCSAQQGGCDSGQWSVAFSQAFDSCNDQR